MATYTKHGLKTPEYGDLVTIPTLVGENNETLEALFDNVDANKADKVNGTIPKSQLPYFSEAPTFYVNGKALYPITFVDVQDGRIFLTDDGEGDYILTMTYSGKVVAKRVIPQTETTDESTDEA